MKIGICGSRGILGEALKYGFSKLGHEILEHDIVIEGSRIDNLLPASLIFICVPTPSKNDGECDTSIVCQCVKDLEKLGYKGHIVIKSTTTPGFTQSLIDESVNPFASISHCPEWLRERHSFHDFVEGHHILVIGTHSDVAFDLIVKAHGNYPKNIIRLTPTESELAKYFHNVFNAMRVVYANGFYEICKKLGANYTKIKNAVVKQPAHVDCYLDVNESFRGYAGYCLVPETLIYTKDGVKRIDQINIGDEVYSHTGALRKVTDVLVRTVKNERVYGIKPQGGDEIYLTGEHPVYSQSTNRFYSTTNGKLKFQNAKIDKIALNWTNASNINKGDYVFVPTFKTLNIDSEINEDIAFLLGLYAAEGSIENDDNAISNRISFALHIKEEFLQNEIKRIAKEQFGVTTHLSAKDGLGCQVRFSSADAKKIMFEHCGKYSWAKKLSSTLLQSPKNIIAKFLLGYLMGDGHFGPRSMTLATVSEDLFYAVKQMFYVLGLPHTTKISQPRRGRDDVYHRKAYYIKLGDKATYYKLCEITGYPKKDIELKLERSPSFNFGEGIIAPVKSVQVFQYTGKVFNLEIEEDNSYVTVGFTVHNCLPKDSKALMKLAEDLGLDCKIFDTIVKDNYLYKRTVFPGMRM